LRSFLTELRNIAVNDRLLSESTLVRLRRAQVLLGSRRVRRDKHSDGSGKKVAEDEYEEDDWEYEYDLLPAGRVFIADDTNGYQLFGDAVFCCPQEDLLEGALSLTLLHHQF
jgi:hypothetical protein